MKPLKVALVHRSGASTEERTIGYWSYPVPEFTWTHIPVEKGFKLDKKVLSKDYDLIYYEDGKLFGNFYGTGVIPICYSVIDSILSEEHYQLRREQARQTNLILVDQDRLERFTDLGVPVKRFGYCVNDHLFKDYGQPRSVDVGCYMNFDADRRILHEWLQGFCSSKGYSYEASSKLRGGDYARAFNRTKVVVTQNRNPCTRSHRTFDVMASRTCLLTSPLPEISGESRVMGIHYRDFHSSSDLGKILDTLLLGSWEDYATSGYELVRVHYTWAIRAKELRQILSEVFQEI